MHSAPRRSRKLLKGASLTALIVGTTFGIASSGPHPAPQVPTISLSGRMLETTAAVATSTPGAPTSVGAVAGNARVTLSWTAPSTPGSSAITDYLITPYIGTVSQGSEYFASASTTEVLGGLTNGTAYTFTVAAVNNAGVGAASLPSNAVTPITTPTAPTAVSAVGNNAQATLAWTVPASNGGSAITGYVVTPYIGTVAQTPQQVGVATSSDTVMGLTNGTTYTFTVSAVNKAGIGAASVPSNAVTPVTTPTAPTTVSATGGDAQATVTWAPPASTGGSAITGYVVTPYIGTVAQTPQQFAATATTGVVSSLTNGTAYTFTVAASNAAGVGIQSSLSNAVTPLAPVTRHHHHHHRRPFPRWLRALLAWAKAHR